MNAKRQGIRDLRSIRIGAMCGATVSLVALPLDIFVLHVWQAALAQAFLLLVTASVVLAATRRMRRQAQRPDHSAIARMEREVWGQTFGRSDEHCS